MRQQPLCVRLMLASSMSLPSSAALTLSQRGVMGAGVAGGPVVHVRPGNCSILAGQGQALALVDGDAQVGRNRWLVGGLCVCVCVGGGRADRSETAGAQVQARPLAGWQPEAAQQQRHQALPRSGARGQIVAGWLHRTFEQPTAQPPACGGRGTCSLAYAPPFHPPPHPPPPPPPRAVPTPPHPPVLPPPPRGHACREQQAACCAASPCTLPRRRPPGGAGPRRTARAPAASRPRRTHLPAGTPGGMPGLRGDGGRQVSHPCRTQPPAGACDGTFSVRARRHAVHGLSRQEAVQVSDQREAPRQHMRPCDAGADCPHPTCPRLLLQHLCQAEARHSQAHCLRKFGPRAPGCCGQASLAPKRTLLQRLRAPG